MWERFLERWRELTREQKVSAVLLTVCGILAMGLSLVRIRAHISEPFLVSKSSILATKKLIGETNVQKEDREKRIDTDGDGLSDYDEVNQYHTNPNLRDTCGDGVSDNIRVTTGKNLDCVGNRGPGAGAIDTAAVKARFDEVMAPIDLKGLQGAVPNIPGVTVPQDAPGATQATIEQAVPREPAAIRAMLVGKVADEKLKLISDDELLKMYDRAFIKTNTAITSTSPSNPTP